MGGHGQGEYIQDTTYKYVGYGGDFDVARPRRNFTWVICPLSLLLLIPLLCWLLSGSSSSLPFDCEAGFGGATMFENSWSQAQKDYCCMTVGRGCATTALPAPIVTVPPTPSPPATPSGPVDPFNCAVDAEDTWAADKKAWCSRHCRRDLQILTTAMMDSQIGRLVGPCRRRNGAAGFMERGAQTRAVGA